MLMAFFTSDSADLTCISGFLNTNNKDKKYIQFTKPCYSIEINFNVTNLFLNMDGAQNDLLFVYFMSHLYS